MGKSKKSVVVKTTKFRPSDLVETHMEMFRRLTGPFGHGKQQPKPPRAH